MAAAKTLSQLPQSDNSVAPPSTVITLIGYGIRVNVDRGHLILHDGIGSERRTFRLPRVGHGLKRLVIIGSDGYVSLSAIRWLASQDAALTVLDRDGSVLATTGPVRPSDARLRRAQVMAMQNGIALLITRELLGKKLEGQEQVARKKLLDSRTADVIHDFRMAVAAAETIDAIRQLESQGAAAYWTAWRDLPITFPKSDLPRVPEHWRRFETRKSPLTGSQRLAANPANAMLNYLYAVLESETRLAVAALGLDPGLGFWHVDMPARDSLACDLMEPVRANVDAYLLDWVSREPLKRSWFFEQRDGNCRLMSTLAIELSQTARIWGRAVAPFAEWVAHVLWSGSKKSSENPAPPTRLTQRHKREAQGASPFSRPDRPPKLPRLCRGCGKSIRSERTHCGRCAIDSATQRLINAAEIGRQASKPGRNTERRGDGRPKQFQHGTPRLNQRGSQLKCMPRKFSHCWLGCQTQ